VPHRLLLRAVTHHSAFFQQVCANARATDVVGLVEVDLNQLTKATAIVVAQRLGITKGLQNGVGLQGGSRVDCKSSRH